MRQVFFNNFKEKILKGQVPDVITASGIPFTTEFLDTYDNTDIAIEQYRTLSDFDSYSNGNSATKFEDTKFKYTEYGIEYSGYYENDVSEKPLFINPENYQEFLQIYSGEIRYEDPYIKGKFDSYISNDANINSGFYYVTKKSQLKWIADRCNDENNFNNRIIVVLGDDIGNPDGSNPVLLDTVIGNSPKKPFAGIFDLNGHKLSNLVISCKENSNGLIGYLSPDGIVRDAIVQDLNFKCENKISLKKIKDDCSDVVVGGLVGTNYGTVENVITSGTFQFNGFCPEVYLTENKYEYEAYDNVVNNRDYNCFFPSKFCINSIYNVIPYVGWFCEGADSYFNDVGNPLLTVSGDLDPENLFWNTRNNIDCLLGLKFRTFGFPNFYDTSYNYDHYLEGKLASSVMFDQTTVELGHVIPENDLGVTKSENGDGRHYLNDNSYFADVYRQKADGYNVDLLPPLITLENDQRIPERVLTNSLTNLGKIKSWNETQEQEIGDASTYYQYANLDNEYGSYLARQIRDQVLMYLYRGEKVTTHQKMNPYSRIAYFCSPIVGNNFGKIRSIDCRHVIRESQDTFVGFIGNVCGKENCGAISDVNSVLDIQKDDSDSHAERVNAYTNNLEFKPSYPDKYANLVNTFGYNWDYFQSPNGLNEDELEKYSNVSASAIKVSDKYYRYHDLCHGTYSGVKREALDRYVFNMLKYDDVRESNEYCNFNLTDLTEEESRATSTKIPDSIRDKKLKIELVASDDLPDTFALQIGIDPYRISERSTFKLFNPYDAEKRDNVYEKLRISSEEVDNGFRGISVSHLDYSQLGDACKVTSLQDKPSFSMHGEYQITMSDVMNYCPAFRGELGKTIDNAFELAKNLMDAKIAMGCEMLANPYVRADQQVGIETLGTSNTNPAVRYVIPAHTGPNDTDEDWDVGGDEHDIADMCWYMQPGEYDGGTVGPVPYNPAVKQYIGANCSAVILNSGTIANKPNFFCSIKPDGKWDLYGDRATLDGETFNENENYAKAAIARSVIDISVKSGAEDLLRTITDAAKLSDSWSEIVGEAEFESSINKIWIPVANRTQNDVYQSETFEGVEVSGIYLHEVAQHPRWRRSWLNHAVPDASDPEQVGNLDYAYIDISIAVQEENGDYRIYPMLVELPIKDLYLPISCINASDPLDPRPTSDYTDDLAHREEAIVTTRSFACYHLVPAYDMYDAESEELDFRLKSIYNVGGICGMINHSQRFIEHGAYDLKESGYIRDEGSEEPAGSNRAEVGSIKNCCVKISERAIDYINSTLLYQKNEEGTLEEKNSHTIAIANKFGGVAAVYEYRQNDMGTSPATLVTGADIDGLQRLDFQKFKIEDVVISGPEDFFTGGSVSPEVAAGRGLYKIFSKVFSPLVEWSNISNILDTTNFYLINDERDANCCYSSRQSSNFPIAGNIHQGFAVGNWESEKGAGFFVGQSDSRLLAKAWPIIEPGRIYPTEVEENLEMKIRERKFNRVGSNSTGISTFVSADEMYPRLNRSKRYDLFPSVLLELDRFYLYGDVDDPSFTEIDTHMSPVANASCSEYNDIYEQTLSGNGHFVNRKLSKPVMLAPITLHGNRYDLKLAERASDLPMINQRLIDCFSWRYSEYGGITDRYFTWDWDRVEVEKTKLLFTIKYKRAEGKRGLWIHQHDRADTIEKLRYPMSGDGVYNDGSNVHLGYMPSREGIVDLMNTIDLDVGDQLYDEGRSVDGEDFRGILLFDTADGSLIALFDRGYSADMNNGTYIAELKQKTEIDGMRYGLLAELKV